MCRKGWLRLDPSGGDGRTHKIAVTAEGRLGFEKAIPSGKRLKPKPPANWDRMESLR
jgi:hypothetical protein